MATSPTNKRRNSGARFNLRIRYLTCLEGGEFPQVAALLSLCFLQRCGAEDSCSAGLPSHLRRFPLKYKTRLASAESTDPKRDRLVESHLSRNERWATPPHRQGSLLSHSIFAEQMPGFAVGVPQSRARWN